LANGIVAVVMGVSGVGKTTIATAVAERLGWAFQEGDALHPAANIEKMKGGQPLSDADRAPWLAQIGYWIDAQRATNRSGIITCSALKRRYRDQLRAGRPNVVLVYIAGDQATVERRLADRTGHFMPVNLLASQFAALEPPAAAEAAITVSASERLDDQIAAITQALLDRAAS
jgi:gluconokinase